LASVGHARPAIAGRRVRGALASNELLCRSSWPAKAVVDIAMCRENSFRHFHRNTAQWG